MKTKTALDALSDRFNGHDQQPHIHYQAHN